MGFGHIYHPDGLNYRLLSQSCILETAPAVGTTGMMSTSRSGQGVRSLLLPRAISTIKWWSHLLDDLSQQTDVIFLIFIF